MRGAAPNPFSEIRLTTLQSLRGANYWSSRPVTRMDLAVGAYEDISSAQVPGVTDALVDAMPGLMEHRCSIGTRGGFVTRLRRGTYVPHVAEHIALELQIMAGHDVGYGKTRGGDVDGEYTVIVEHHHAGVGMRAAALALEIVQRAFAGGVVQAEHAVRELRSLSDSPDAPAIAHHVLCGITGGGPRHATRNELARRGVDGEGEDALIVEVTPGFLLQAGLPYARSRIAIVLDADLEDVPDRYRDAERARRLVSVLADGVDRDGVVIVPGREWEVQDRARDVGARVAVFSVGEALTAKDRKVACAAACAADGRIVVEREGVEHDAGELRPDVPVAAQVAATLAAVLLREPAE